MMEQSINMNLKQAYKIGIGLALMFRRTQYVMIVQKQSVPSMGIICTMLIYLENQSLYKLLVSRKLQPLYQLKCQLLCHLLHQLNDQDRREETGGKGTIIGTIKMALIATMRGTRIITRRTKRITMESIRIKRNEDQVGYECLFDVIVSPIIIIY